jgi:hypothetical protein
VHTLGVHTSALHASPFGSGVPAAQFPAPSHFSMPLHGFPSAHDVPAGRFAPGTQTPVAEHVPAPWHALPAEHVAPGVIVYVIAPVVALHEPTVQTGPLLTFTGAPAQLPAVHTSPVVHGFPSLQVVPSATVGFEHVPVLGLHVPAPWHWSDAAHVRAVPAQAPLVHTSPVVHALPSLHVVPFAAVGFEHAPVLGLQVPATWHWSEAVQVTGLDPVHVPAWQAYAWKHAFGPVQAAPLLALDHDDVELDGVQTWHALDGLAAPAA